MIEAITKGLATQATGFACVIDGVLDMRTISDTAKGCAARTIGLTMGPLAAMISYRCQDPTCDCTVKALKTEVPNARLVAIEIKVTEA